MWHFLWSLVFVIIGLWTVFFGLAVASPVWFEDLLGLSYYCRDCSKKLEQDELEKTTTKERYLPRQI